MSTHETKTAHVELVALGASDGNAHWTSDVVLHPQGSKVRVGLRDEADIALPPGRYKGIARMHFGIVFLTGRTFLEFYHSHPVATLDGQPADGATLDAQAHELAIGDYRFRLTITPA